MNLLILPLVYLYSKIDNFAIASAREISQLKKVEVKRQVSALANQLAYKLSENSENCNVGER